MPAGRVARVAVVGNLARDVVDGGAPTPGGCPRFAVDAFRRLGRAGQLVTRFRPDDAPLFRGIPATVLDASATSGFLLDYRGEERRMSVAEVGESWRPEDGRALEPDVRWVHVAPLLRSDFPPDALAAFAEGRALSLDGQGLVRVPRVGPLELDAEFDPALLEHVTALKLSEEEARLVDVARLRVPEILVTRGSRGVVVHAEGEETYVPAARAVHGVQTTGAGDLFMVGYATARVDGAGPVDAARSATRLVAELLEERAASPDSRY